MSDNPLIAPSKRTLRTFVPILAWLPGYRWARDLGPDLIAGFTLAALLIPESMGYAGVAGVAPEVGLYAALGAIVAYAVTGGTSILVVGPAAAVAALSASIVGDLDIAADPVVLTAALAVASGVILILAGVLRFGWIVNFVSRPVLHAFIAGLAISIIVGQLDGLVGAEVDGESTVEQFVDLLRDLAGWNPTSVLIGVGAIVTLVLLERFVPKVPAAVLVVAVGIVSVAGFGIDDRGVEIVGEIPRGLPDAGLPSLSLAQWGELLAGGFALLLVGFSEGYAAGSAVAAATGEEIDPDQELIGSGAANLASGLVGGMAVSGSLSKSSASEAAGARSQMTNLVSGVILLATLLFLAPVFEKLPEPVLAAVVIVAVLGSADPSRLLRLWTINRADFAAALVTFVLVLVWETLPAMIVGVVLSLAFAIHRASFPDVVELHRNVDGSYTSSPPVVSTDRPADDGSAVGLAVLRFESSLIYANSDRLLRAARTLIATRPELTHLVLDGEMTADLDSSGADALERLDDELRDHGVELHLARFHRRARVQIDRSHLRDRFEGRLHATLRAATERHAGADPHDPR